MVKHHGTTKASGMRLQHIIVSDDTPPNVGGNGVARTAEDIDEG